MQAACYGHLTCVMLLVQYKADVKLCNNWGASALVGAAQGGFSTVVQVGCTGSRVYRVRGAKLCLYTAIYCLFW